MAAALLYTGGCGALAHGKEKGVFTSKVLTWYARGASRRPGAFSSPFYNLLLQIIS